MSNYSLKKCIWDIYFLMFDFMLGNDIRVSFCLFAKGSTQSTLSPFFHLMFNVLNGFWAAHSVHHNTVATGAERETPFLCVDDKKKDRVGFPACIMTWNRFISVSWNGAVWVRGGAVWILRPQVAPSSRCESAGGGCLDYIFSSSQPLPMPFPLTSQFFFPPHFLIFIHHKLLHISDRSFCLPLDSHRLFNTAYLPSVSSPSFSRPSSMISTCRNTQRTLRR